MTSKITRILSASCICLAFFAASVPCQEPAPSPAGAARSDDFAACVRGRVITRLEVEREFERLKKLDPAASDEELRWEARYGLAERILLVETAKTFTKKIPDDPIRRYYLDRGLDENFISKHFVELRGEFAGMLYFRARIGTDQLPGVAPDMASYVLVSPEDIRSYYQHNREMFTRKGKTTLAWLLFPATAFSDPADRLEAAQECRALLEAPGAAAKEIAERWPGCILQEEEVISGGGTKFLPPLMEFIEKGKSGEVSGVIALEGGLIVSRIIEKIEKKTFSFNEIQNQIATLLKEGKQMNARRLIARELMRREKIFWPVDLFDRHAGRKPRRAPPASTDKPEKNP